MAHKVNIAHFAGALAAAGLASAFATTGAQAATLTYTLSGVLSGTFDGNAFTDEAFTFTLVSSTADLIVAPPPGVYQHIEPVTGATVTLAGIGTFTVEEPMSLGMENGSEIALDQYEPRSPPQTGYDLRNVFLFGLVSDINLYQDFGPISAGASFAEVIGDVIPTSGGDLQFTSTDGSGLIFSLEGAVTGAPEPAGWALMLVGIGVCGATLRYRRRAATLGPA